MHLKLSNSFFALSLLYIVAAKPNFLFIIVDDLRPALGCYSDKNSYTPNIDAIAKNGITFNRAYAQQALCAPSRNSLLTSRRPDTLGLYDFYSYWRKTAGNFTTLPQYLKDIGYVTVSIGKVFHPGISSNDSDDSPYSWSQEPFHPQTNKYKDAPVCSSNNDHNNEPLSSNLICPVDVSAMPLGTLPDIENVQAAKVFLNDYAKEINRKPFFLALGLQKPHIPLKYPQQYLKHHPIDKFNITNYYWPENVSSVAYNPWTDLRIRDDVQQLNLSFPWQIIPETFARRILQSYYSAISYIDELIGTIMEELKRLKLDNNTVVILTSDHGWSLGEHSQWAKYSNFEVAVRVPLILSIPEKTTNKNLKTNAIVELVDLFPTIAELSGNPIEICHENITEILCSEGMSFVPIIDDIVDNKKVKWKKFAFSQYPRPGISPTWSPNSDKPRLHQIKIMGYSLRTKRYRYTAWISFDSSTMNSNWSSLIADELYDHTNDPHEMFNQVDNTHFSNIKSRLMKMLKNGWRQGLHSQKYSPIKTI